MNSRIKIVVFVLFSLFWGAVNAKGTSSPIIERNVITDTVIDNSLSGVFFYKIVRNSEGLSFSDQLNEQNTIYDIRDSFDLKKATITIPSNSVLLFNGGKISNGTLIGQNTVVRADAVQIFDIDLSFSGTWSVDPFLVEWLGAKADSKTDNTIVLNKIFQTPFSIIKFGSGVYLVNETVFINSIEDGNKLIRIQGSNDYSMDNNGTIIKTSSIAPIFSIRKRAYQLRIHDIHFFTTAVDGVGLDFEKTLSEFHLSHLKFTGAFSTAIKMNGSIGTIEQCYFSEVLSKTARWRDVDINRCAIDLSGSQISINNCNFWRVRTGIILGKVVSCAIYNNWFESSLHYDILFRAFTLTENVNIYNNTFLNAGFINGKQYDSSAASLKFDGNDSALTFFCRTLNIYSNYCWNEAPLHFIDFEWNKNRASSSSFSNIHVFNNDIDGNTSYLFFASAGATALDIVFEGNSIKKTALLFNDQYGRKYRCYDTPKYGNTKTRHNYIYWTQGDTYYDSDLGKLVIFVRNAGKSTWVDSMGAPVD